MDRRAYRRGSEPRCDGYRRPVAGAVLYHPAAWRHGCPCIRGQRDDYQESIRGDGANAATRRSCGGRRRSAPRWRAGGEGDVDIAARADAERAVAPPLTWTSQGEEELRCLVIDAPLALPWVSTGVKAGNNCDGVLVDDKENAKGKRRSKRRRTSRNTRGYCRGLPAIRSIIRASSTRNRLRRPGALRFVPVPRCDNVRPCASVKFTVSATGNAPPVPPSNCPRLRHLSARLRARPGDALAPPAGLAGVKHWHRKGCPTTA
jgi:hypothetical protein